MTQLPAAMVWVQLPSLLQESAVHASPSSQPYAVPAHTPALQTSFLVQALPSLHAVPSTWLLHTVACAGSQT
jgi:hypothetical protein